MEIGRQLRKLLILCEESSARDTMRVLLGSMGCQCVVASTVQQPIAVFGAGKPRCGHCGPAKLRLFGRFDRLRI